MRTGKPHRIKNKKKFKAQFSANQMLKHEIEKQILENNKIKNPKSTRVNLPNFQLGREIRIIP
jgi:hypothetical protein